MEFTLHVGRPATERDKGVTHWFIQIDAKEQCLGPLHPSELLSRVRSGEVTRETKLRMDNGAWFKAGNVGGLFEAAMRPTIEYLCPACESLISEPPTSCDRCGQGIQHAITRITENTILSSVDPPHAGQADLSAPKWLQPRKEKRTNNDPPSELHG